MAFRRKDVLREVLLAIGAVELAEARRVIPSRQLRAAVELILDESDARAALFIPHYWAVYYHDGRGAVHPVSARKLVFFDNPHEDPRIPGGRRKVRYKEERRLTRAEFLEGLRINRERAARGQRPFMFVVDRVGPSRPRPFFDRMARGAAERVAVAARNAFDRQIQALVNEDPDVRPERRTARGRIG